VLRKVIICFTAAVFLLNIMAISVLSAPAVGEPVYDVETVADIMAIPMYLNCRQELCFDGCRNRSDSFGKQKPRKIAHSKYNKNHVHVVGNGSN